MLFPEDTSCLSSHKKCFWPNAYPMKPADINPSSQPKSLIKTGKLSGLGSLAMSVYINLFMSVVSVPQCFIRTTGKPLLLQLHE